MAEAPEAADEGEPVRLTVVVPAFEEGTRIADTVARLRKSLAGIPSAGATELVVVDDGSSDDTADEARAAGADRVIVLPRNRGKGAALRAGVAAARGRTVAFVDADLSYSPEQVLGLLEVVEGGIDFAAGSRKHRDAVTLVRARRLRDLSGRLFNVVTRLVLQGRYGDTQCGIKAFRGDAARLLFSTGRIDGFAFDVELFYLAERFGLSVAEVPVALVSTNTSTVRVGPDALAMLRDLARIRWWGATGRYGGR